MRASRLLAILILLQLRGRLTAQALADEFEVSVRTIYRDIDALSAAGVPVYGDHGPGGGFALLDGYATRLTGLDAAEAAALPLIGLPGTASELGLGPAARAARTKLLAALPGRGGDAAAAMAEAFHVDTLDWYRAAELAPLLPLVVRAVLDRQSLTITYTSWQATRDWIIDPLGVVMKAGRYYCVAKARGRLTIFRIGAMMAAHETGNSFVRPADFDLASYWAAEQVRFEAALRQLPATLALSAEGLRRFAEQGRHAREAVAAARPSTEPGWFEVTLNVEPVLEAARQLITLGPDVEVIAPAELREALAELAEAVVRRHCPG